MYDRICNLDKIEKHYYNVRLNSKHRQKIFNFETFYVTNILQIYFVLKNRCYKHSHYNIFLVKEPKYRIIMSEIISDKIVNHVLSEEVLLPFIEPLLIPMNVATRRDKGIKMGISYTKMYVNTFKMKYDNFYILKCDISKYFYNVDHEVLLEKLRKVIPDEDVLNLIENIISTTNDERTNDKILRLIEMEKEHLYRVHPMDYEYRLKELEHIPFYRKGKGIPIGNMSSQIFAIFYLNDLDHYIKEKLKIKCYVRYMDDFILMHPDKEYLKYCLLKIKEELSKVKLSLNGKTQIVSMKHGFSFMGYRFILKGKRLHVLMNSKTKNKIRKKLNYLRTHDVDKEYKRSAFASYKGYFLNCDSGAFLYRHGWYKKSK